jgi:hypothetical protein
MDSGAGGAGYYDLEDWKTRHNGSTRLFLE